MAIRSMTVVGVVPHIPFAAGNILGHTGCPLEGANGAWSESGPQGVGGAVEALFAHGYRHRLLWPRRRTACGLGLVRSVLRMSTLTVLAVRSMTPGRKVTVWPVLAAHTTAVTVVRSAAGKVGQGRSDRVARAEEARQ
jgi:hypothetical protein